MWKTPVRGDNPASVVFQLGGNLRGIVLEILNAIVSAISIKSLCGKNYNTIFFLDNLAFTDLNMWDLAWDKTGQSSSAGSSAAEVDVDPKMAKCCQMTSCLLVAELGKICWWFVPLFKLCNRYLDLGEQRTKNQQEVTRVRPILLRLCIYIEFEFYWGSAFTLLRRRCLTMF